MELKPSVIPELAQQQQQENSTLALLLQSLQTSLLMEQQQKATLNAINNTSNGSGTNFLSLLNGLQANGCNSNNNNNVLNGGGIEAVLGGGQQQHRNGSGPSTMGHSNNNNNHQQHLNGIERLLTAAALFPQLQPQQQPKTPTMLRQELGAGAGGSVRKIMEESECIFFSLCKQIYIIIHRCQPILVPDALNGSSGRHVEHAEWHAGAPEAHIFEWGQCGQRRVR